jgi:alanine racemase
LQAPTATIPDFSDVGEAAIGDRVTVIGADGNERISLQNAASWQGMSALFLLLGLGKSIARVYRDDGPGD